MCEEVEKAWGPSFEDSEPSVSNVSQGDTLPPSPRTLKAIQAAMDDSSDEEKVDQDKKDGSLSPRTALAIQQALTEEEDVAAEHGTLISSTAVKLQAIVHHPASQVVISSSEEETEPGNLNSLLNGKSNFEGNVTAQSSHVKDRLFVSRSEDEMEEVIGQRNKAIHFVAQQNTHTEERKSEKETRTEHLMEEQERRESERRFVTKKEDLDQTEGAASSHHNTLFRNLSAQECEKPLSVQTNIQPVLLEQRRSKVTEGPEQTNGDAVKSEGSEESESEGTVVENLRSHLLILP